MARFRSVLVPVDLSPFSDRVLGRVARLPIATDARLTLLHAVPGGLPSRDQRRAERDAKKVLADEARHLARSLPRTVRIDPVVAIGAPHTEIAARARSVKAELIVMGRGGGRVLRDIALGSTAERVIRQAQLPVLVVRLAPRAAYRRPALALDLDDAAHDVVDLMLRVVPPPRPPATVIHAFELPYYGYAFGGLPRDEVEERKIAHQLEGSRAVAKLIAAALAQAKVDPKDAPIWRSHVRYGSPRLVIEKAVEKVDTDLLVLGSRGHRGLAYMFLGTVAGDVLRNMTCDVLIVPPLSPEASGR